MNLTIGFSPCPNDCFVFDAIVNRRIDLEGLTSSVRMADVNDRKIDPAHFSRSRRPQVVQSSRLRKIYA